MGDSVLRHDLARRQAGSGISGEADDLGDPQWRVGGRLGRSFRKRDGIALIVSSVVGVGIFTTPTIIANLVPNPTAILALWIVGGLLALAGAASYAKLASFLPAAGGEYTYLSKSYGPLAGFLSGWTSLIAGFSGSVAASAVALVTFAGQYFPDVASDRSLVSLKLFDMSAALSSRTLAAVVIIALFAALHTCSLLAGKITQSALALVLVGMIAVFVGCGFASGRGSWHFQSTGSHFGAMNWLLALVPVMFTYSGWNAAAYVSEELHASRRSMRPVLLVGTCIVIALYTTINALYLYAIPVGQLRSATDVVDTASRALFGAGSQLLTPVLIVALLGAISAMTIAGPRVYFAMARDGAFIPAFARTSRRFGTPALAIALQAAWSIVLVMIGGFDQILMYTGFAIVLSSGAAVAGLFVLQRQNGHPVPISRAKLVVPGIFVLASGAMVLDTVLEAPKVALIGLVLIAAGIPVYTACRRNSLGNPALQTEATAGD